ncbi:hypothetical protein ABZ467_29260, partial [Streptomyces sp. NPDC005727]|uniref:hypothetical protein n=1 Tax=Streptomyces sp. NPDC005727 TaxID=3157053 RepID=UPI0033FFB90B
MSLKVSGGRDPQYAAGANPGTRGPRGSPPLRDHLIWLGKLLVVSRIVERLVPDELWELFQRV